MAVAALVKAREKSSYLPAALFGQGFDIEEEHLRASFRAVLDDMRSYIGTTAAANARFIHNRSDEASATGVVIAARPRASTSPRTWKARLAASDLDVAWPDTLYAMLDLIYAAQQQTGDMLKRLLIGSGTAAAASMPHLRQVLKHASIDRMENATKNASMHEFTQAREVYDNILVEATELRLRFPKGDLAGIDDTLLASPLTRAVPILFVLSMIRQKRWLRDRIMVLRSSEEGPSR